MKITIYSNSDNLIYNDAMSNFIFFSDKEKVSFLSNYNKCSEVEVQKFASGNTCVCYRIVNGINTGKIIKQFCPSNDVFVGRVKMAADGNLLLKDESEFYKSILKEKYSKFLHSSIHLNSLVKAYNNEEINILLNEKLCLTNIGYVFLCDSAETLERYFVSMIDNLVGSKISWKSFLYEVLEKTFRILNNLKMLHNEGLLALDLKPENLCVPSIDHKKEKIGVRLIDYGSIVSLKSFYNELIQLKGSDIRDYIITKYFPVNKKFYSIVDIENVLFNIWDIDNETKGEDLLKNLDIIATLKILVSVLEQAICVKYNLFNCIDKEIITTYMERTVKGFVIQFSQIDEPILEIYNIFYLLSILSKICLTTQIIDINEIITIITIILSILRDDVFWPYDETMVQIQKKYILQNRNLRKKSNELEIILRQHFKTDKLIDKIIEKCDEGGNLLSPGELCYNFLFAKS